MHKTPYGVRNQRHHCNIQPTALEWFDRQFPPSNFNGRFQLGYRNAEAIGIYPLCTGDLETVRAFIETMHISSHIDYYITANAVSGVSRTSDQLFSLHNIVIDIDVHSEEMSSEEIEEIIDGLWFRLSRDLFSDEDYPSPTSAIASGRGIQLWWAIEPMSSKCLTWYKEIASTLADSLEDMLADYPDEFKGVTVDRASSKNAVGYFRLPGTWNTRAERPVVILDIAQCDAYDTKEVIKWAKAYQREHEPPAPVYSETESFQYSDAEVYILGDIRVAAFFRVRQIMRLRAIRNNEIGEETRNNMCFIVYNALLPSQGPEKAWDKLKQFNAGFKNPMTEKELHQTIDTSLRKNGYRYKNQSIIDFLGITEEEQQQIEMYAPTQPYSPFTRMSKHPARKAAAKVSKENRNAKIIELYQQGKSKKEICEMLNISFNTVAGILKNIPNRENTPKTIRAQKAMELLNSGRTAEDVAEQLGVDIRSVFSYKKEYEKKLQKTSYI